VPSGLAAVVYATLPLSSALMTGALGMERLTPQKVGGAVVALVGVFMLFSGSFRAHIAVSGLVAISIGATAAGLGSVLLKRGPRQDPFGANAVGCAIGVPIAAAVSFALGERHVLPTTLGAAWPLLYLTLAGSLGAYVIMSWLVNRWPVTRTSYVTVIVPVIALGLGVLVRHEPLTRMSLLGAGFVLLGLFIGMFLGVRPSAAPGRPVIDSGAPTGRHGRVSSPKGGPLALLLVLGALGALGCGGGGGEAPGTVRGACFPNDTCNAGLTCLSGFCVLVTADDGGGVDAGNGDVVRAGGDASQSPEACDAAHAPDALAPEAGSTAVPHPRLPQVSNLGGPVLETPRVQPLYYAADTDVDDIQAFLRELTHTSYWSDTTSEYGVGPLEVSPPITIQGSPPVTMTDDMLSASLASNLSGPFAPWGAADPSTIYMLVLPQGSTVTFGNGATCCSDYGGYHFESTNIHGVTVPYAVICSCPAAFGLNLTPLQARTTTVSHELVEAATDPFPNSNPSYSGTDHANIVWYYLTGGELADMCALNPDANFVPPGATYMVQRSWSNAAARASQDPCVPRAAPAPYFNSYPVLSAIDFGTAQYPYLTLGVTIPLGQSKTIDVVLSGDPPNRLWSVGVYTYEDLRGGDTTNLGVSLDKAGGKNGDILRLTLTPKHINQNLGGEAFIIVSRFGADTSFQSNVTMGLVTNQ
jgi:hypothetical protein